MRLKDFNNSREFTKLDCKNKLIRLLQSAHAGEKAAANAYWGHGYSLFVRDPIEKREILEIMKEELDHRARIREMLRELGAKPNPVKESIMYMIGITIGLFCLVGTWIIPMYGAGLLESKNIEEYEVLARLAQLSDHDNFIDELLTFGEIEWDHELYFRNKAKDHWLAHVIGLWPKPEPREKIRNSLNNFLNR